MASLLDDPLAMPRAGLLGLPVPEITPPDDRTVSQGDALAEVFRGVAERVRQERAKSAEMGLWNDETGLPTGKGLLDAAQQYGETMLLGTNTPGIRAYHGSPHSFDRFSTERIGTGEGAQAYGHGLYFAEKEGTARSYRDTLGTRSMDLTDPGNLAAWMYHKNMGDRTAAITELETSLNSAANYPKSYKPGDAERFKVALDQLKSGAEMPSAPGSMYEVQINANPEHMLHWDKPLSEQSPQVQKALMNLPESHRFKPEWTGANLYESAIVSPGQYRDPVAATQALRNAGIPGIRYLDQGSRGAGEGSHNLVVFDDATIEILRKYGLAGLMLGGGAGIGAANQQQ